MYSKRSPPTAPAGIEFPNISMPGMCGIAPSTGINRSRRYSSIFGTVLGMRDKLNFHTSVGGPMTVPPSYERISKRTSLPAKYNPQQSDEDSCRSERARTSVDLSTEAANAARHACAIEGGSSEAMIQRS